jgi:hypothetical protein
MSTAGFIVLLNRIDIAGLPATASIPWRMRMRDDNREVAQGFSPRRATSDFSHVMDEISTARTTDQNFWQRRGDTINKQTNLDALGFPANVQIGQDRFTTGGGELAQQRGADGTGVLGTDANNREGQPCENETRRFKFQPDGNAIYTLRQGDNLSAIARDLLTQHQGRTPDNQAITRAATEIARVNNIRPDTVYHPGQQLVIPMWMRSLTHGEIPQREITLPPNSPGARAERQARREQTDNPAQTGRGDRTSPPGQRQNPETQPQSADGARERQRAGQGPRAHRGQGHGGGGRRSDGGSERRQGQGGRGHGGAERPALSRRRRGQTAADQSPNPAEATPGGGGDAPAGGGDTQTPAEAPPATQNTPVDATPARAEAVPGATQNQPEQQGFGGVQYPESGPTRSVAEGLLEATRPNGDIFNPLAPPGQAGPILGRMTEFSPPRAIRFDNGQGGSVDVAGVTHIFSAYMPGRNGAPGTYESVVRTDNGPMRFTMNESGRVTGAPRLQR